MFDRAFMVDWEISKEDGKADVAQLVRAMHS